MARTIKNNPSRWYSKESKPARKMTNRKNRRETNQALQMGEFDAITGFKHTQGWLTY